MPVGDGSFTSVVCEVACALLSVGGTSAVCCGDELVLDFDLRGL